MNETSEHETYDEESENIDSNDSKKIKGKQINRNAIRYPILNNRIYFLKRENIFLRKTVHILL